MYIVIDVPGRRLYLYEGSTAFGSFPVAVGKPATPTPLGTYTIVEKVSHPGGVYGTRWLGLSRKHYGIHGTNAPHLIGQAVSNGCIRMNNHQVEHVYDQVRIGTEVRILHQGHAPGPHPTGGIYIVQPGDSLWAIASQYGTNVQALASINNLHPPYIIYPGQKLSLP
ncbi:MAG TPA: L,D-transpeptidase family protein [bacterium]|nr:L,D-transpeptidase family protein [bacterium]